MDAEAGEETEYTKAFGEFMNAYEKEDPVDAKAVVQDVKKSIAETGFNVSKEIEDGIIPNLQNTINAGEKKVSSEMLYVSNKLLQGLGYKEYGPNITPQNLIKALQTVASELKNKEKIALTKMKKNKILTKYMKNKKEIKEIKSTKEAKQHVLDMINLSGGTPMKDMLKTTPSKLTPPASATETPTKIISESAFDDDDANITSISDLLFESDSSTKYADNDFEASQLLKQYVQQNHNKTIDEMLNDDSITPAIVWKIAKREFGVNFQAAKFSWHKLANIIKAGEKTTTLKKFKTPKVNTSPALLSLKVGKKLNFTPGTTPKILKKITSAKSSAKDIDETNLSGFYNPAIDQLQPLGSFTP
jgi:hypothetical protein